MAEKPEDFNLPTSVVSRIVKESLPDGVNVSKEARAALSKAASIFVLYATSCANNFAIQANRKTLTGPDIFSALKEMEFERFVEPLTEHLEAYKLDKANKIASKKKAEKEKEQETAAQGKETAAQEQETEVQEDTSTQEQETEAQEEDTSMQEQETAQEVHTIEDDESE